MDKLSISDAMLAGAKLRPQALYDYFSDQIFNDAGLVVGKSEMVCSCAMGAVYEGATGRIPMMSTSNNGRWSEAYDELLDLYPELKLNIPYSKWPCVTQPALGFDRAAVNPPEEGETLHSLVIHLNTSHKMPREEIATVLKGLGY